MGPWLLQPEWITGVAVHRHQKHFIKIWKYPIIAGDRKSTRKINTPFPLWIWALVLLLTSTDISFNPPPLPPSHPCMSISIYQCRYLSINGWVLKRGNTNLKIAEVKTVLRYAFQAMAMFSSCNTSRIDSIVVFIHCRVYRIYTIVYIILSTISYTNLDILRYVYKVCNVKS